MRRVLVAAVLVQTSCTFIGAGIGAGMAVNHNAELAGSEPAPQWTVYPACVQYRREREEAAMRERDAVVREAALRALPSCQVRVPPRASLGDDRPGRRHVASWVVGGLLIGAVVDAAAITSYMLYAMSQANY